MPQLGFWSYLAQKRQRDGIRHRNIVVGPQEDQDRYAPGSLLALNRGCVVAAAYPLMGWGLDITTAQTDLDIGAWNVVLNADAGNAQDISDTLSGLVCTTSADDNELLQIRTARQFTPATGQKFHASLRMQAASLETLVGFGFCIKNADPIGNLATAATITDVMLWQMDADPGDGVLAPSVRGNAGVIANGTDLSAVTAAQDFELGITGKFGATASMEFWYALNPGVNSPILTKVALTAAQLTQFQAIMTTPPTTMQGFLELKNTAGTSRAGTIKHLEFYVERA